MNVLIIVLILLGVSIFFIFSRQLTNNPNEKGKQIDNLMKGEDFKMVEVFQKNKESFEIVKNFFIENQIAENVAFFDDSNSMEVRTENEEIKMAIENNDKLVTTVQFIFDEGVSYISFNSRQDKLTFSLRTAPDNYRAAIVYHFDNAKVSSFDQSIESKWFLNVVPNT